MADTRTTQGIQETRQVLAAEKLAPVIFDVVENGGVFPLVVTGTSMTPTLHPQRDKVFLVSPKQKVPKRKDIVLFQREDGTYVLHRIIGKNRQGQLKINGDAQTWTEWISPAQILAVVDALERKGKKISADNSKYKLYLQLWGWVKPARPFLFRMNRFLRRKHHSKGEKT